MQYRKSILISFLFLIYAFQLKASRPGKDQANDSMTLMQAYINLSLTDTYFKTLKNERITKIIAFETKELASIQNENFKRANSTLYNFTLSLLHFNNAKLLSRKRKTYNRKELIEINSNLTNAINYFNKAQIEESNLEELEKEEFFELVHFNLEACNSLKGNILALKSRFVPLFNKDIYKDFKRIFYLSKKRINFILIRSTILFQFTICQNCKLYLIILEWMKF